MLNVKRELRVAGFRGTPRDFYALLSTLLGEAFPGWTDEQLKRNPRLALSFCELVRERTHIQSLADPLILGGLENARKQRIRPASFSNN